MREAGSGVALVMMPGEPTSGVPRVPTLAELKAPFVPTTLTVEMRGSGWELLPMPAALSKLTPVAETPKPTPVISVPVEL